MTGKPETLLPITRSALRKLRLRHLELLECLAATPTISAAAALMNLSQPAVSKMITELEAVCDAKLFVRGRTGIVPTARGAVLMRHAMSMIASLDSANGELRALQEGSSGLLRIGSYSSTSILPRLVADLQRQLPRLRVRIHESSPIQLVSMLIEGQLDCVISAFSRDMLAKPRSGELRVQPMVADHICVVASRRHHLAGRKRITWRAAAAERWALPPSEALMRKELSYALTQQGIDPIVPVIESMSALTTRWLMKFDADLLGVMREHQAIEESRAGHLTILPVRPVVPLPDISLITPQARLMDARVSDALQAALNQIRSGDETIGNPYALLKPERPWLNPTPPRDPDLAHPSTP